MMTGTPMMAAAPSLGFVASHLRSRVGRVIRQPKSTTYEMILDATGYYRAMVIQMVPGM